MSCNCNNNCHEQWCPQYLQAVTVPCDEPGCDQQLTTDCVIYTGPDIPCLGLTTGMQLTEILLGILYELHPECNPGTTTTTTAEPLPLRLLYDDINDSYIADPENVDDWNDRFGLPEFGTPFTSVTIIGNEAFLYGGSNITLTYDIFGDVDSILEIDDDAGCIVALTDACLEYGRKTSVSLPACKVGATDAFYGNDLLTYLNLPSLVYAGPSMFHACEILQSFNFPELLVIGDQCFYECYAATEFYIPKCVQLGPSADDDFVFFNISGNNITLTISEVINFVSFGGNPDGDVVYLQTYNTVTLVVV